MLNFLLEQMWVLFVTTGDLLLEIKATFDGQGSESAIAKKYSSAPILAIDDIGKEKPSEWALSILYKIIDARYSSCMPTIFTTQYSKEQLVARLGSGGNRETAEAITSRIWSNKEVHLRGRDRRMPVEG